MNIAIPVGRRLIHGTSVSQKHWHTNTLCVRNVLPKNMTWKWKGCGEKWKISLECVHVRGYEVAHEHE